MSETVLIADDHPLFRQALALAVGRVLPSARVVEAGTLAVAVRVAGEADDLKLILLDLKMPGAVGYSGIALLHAECPTVPILVVSSAEGAAAAEEVRAFGAIDFLSKDSDLDLIEDTIKRAMRGARVPIAQRREAIDPIQEAVAGLTPTQLNKQIAHSLSISEATVKAHMTAIMRKLDVTNRTQAALVARSLGLDLRH